MIDILKQIVISVAILGLGAILIAWLMEFVKHVFYKDNILKWQAELWASSLSMIVTPILYFGLELVGKPILITLYIIIVYLGQREVDMRAVRPMVKKLIDREVNKL